MEEPDRDKPARGGCAVFDVDGTLVDTTYLHAVTWWQAIRQIDRDVPMAAIHRAIGMGSDKLLDHLLGAGRDRDRDDEAQAAHLTLYTTFWTRLRRTPGARELLRRCAGAGMPVVLASSASADELAALRAALDADDAVAAATSSDDAERGKPAPDIISAALDSVAASGPDSVFIGDSVWDAQACEPLGLPFVGLTCGGHSEAELREAGAVAVYRDPATLLESFDSSPLAKLL